MDEVARWGTMNVKSLECPCCHKERKGTEYLLPPPHQILLASHHIGSGTETVPWHMLLSTVTFSVFTIICKFLLPFSFHSKYSHYIFWVL